MKKISSICKTFLLTWKGLAGVTYDDLYSVALEAFFTASRKYNKKRKATFYTYSLNVINKELTRYMVELASNNSISQISLNSMSKEDGLMFEELYGEEDERIKSSLDVTHEIRESMSTDEILSKINEEDFNERINLIMIELSGKNTMSKREKYNLRRRIKYYLKKKDKDNH